MTLVYFLAWPLATSVVLFLLGKHAKVAQALNILFQFVWLGLFAWVNSELIPHEAGTLPILFSWKWLPILKSNLSLGVDGLSLPLLWLTVLLSICLAFYAYGKEKLDGQYLGLFAILNGATVGSLLATDALAFYVFWEFMLIPMYFLIGKWGSKNRVYAALKFFAMTMAGSLPMLLAIVALSFRSDVPDLGWHTLTKLQLAWDGQWSSLQGLVFLGFLAAFAVKVPVWPLHTWLPDAHTEAPTGGSVILAGVLLKLGIYGLLRWCLPIAPEASMAAAPIMFALGMAGILLGSFAAWRQTDIKRLIAYSSVAHLGFMVLGVFSGKVEAMQGALFQNIAHGLSTGVMFLIFGMIYDRTHSRELSEYGGFAKDHAWIATAFVLGVVASVGMPGLPGFVGEFLVLVGTFAVSPWAAILASLGVLLGAVYMLTLVRKMMFGPVSPLVSSHPVKLAWTEWVAIVPLLLAMLYLGFGAQSLLALSEGDIASLSAKLSTHLR